VKEAVEQANHCVSISALLQPLDTAERATVKMISDAHRKYFYILAMSLKLQPGGNLVRAAPSKVHGLGVFAVRDIRKHTCCTAYPIDLLVLHDGGSEPGLRPLVVFSRQHRNSEAEAHRRLKKQLFDYGLDIAPGVAVYADPSTHSPGLCGHMINDPRGTGAEANCVECPIGGGALIGILTLRDVREGEELLMDYGERYWQARSRTGVKTTSRNCAGDV
jgi:SET domain-containing protein